MRKTMIVAGAAALALSATGASAQDITTSFRGFRAEGNVGWDKFQSQGINNEKLGYGGAAGFDGQLGDKIVIGAEGSYWRANKWTQNVSAGVNGGTVSDKSFEEFGAAVRAGYLVTPDLLVFGKGGYASNEQRKRFDAPAGETSYYSHGRTDGYQVGGGVEYSLTSYHTPLPLYVSAQYVYSNFADHTARQRAMLGVGVRFK